MTTEPKTDLQTEPIPTNDLIRMNGYNKAILDVVDILTAEKQFELIRKILQLYKK